MVKSIVEPTVGALGARGLLRSWADCCLRVRCCAGDVLARGRADVAVYIRGDSNGRTAARFGTGVQDMAKTAPVTMKLGAVPASSDGRCQRHVFHPRAPTVPLSASWDLSVVSNTSTAANKEAGNTADARRSPPTSRGSLVNTNSHGAMLSGELDISPLSIRPSSR